ncbi:MAG: TonB family protein [Deltaproteobacteria bacterium]|nr:TonB family protein [Deltaproteobacteria bacterium]
MTKQLTWKHLWLACMVGSVVIHVSGGLFIATRERPPAQRLQAVKVKIVEQPVVAKAEPPPPPPPPPPRERPKPKPKPPKVASERKSPPPKPNEPPPKPVQGLTADAMTAGGKVAAPLGNTLMVEDTGERLKEEPGALQGDMSAEPELIRDSITKPEYTQAAIDAGLEGSAIVEVLVEETGRVLDAELKKRIGFGMDERILTSAKGARFKPRRNRYGRAETAWTEIKFTLQLP